MGFHSQQDDPRRLVLTEREETFRFIIGSNKERNVERPCLLVQVQTNENFRRRR